MAVSCGLDVKILFLRQAAEMYGQGSPRAATSGAAGFDLCADIPKDADCVIAPGRREPVLTGIALEPMREGVAAFVYSRSGLGAVQGLTVAQGVGLIDPDYRGEIKVYLLNTGQESLRIKRGDRIAQMVFQPFYAANFIPVTELGATARGQGGFGHTGSDSELK